MKQTITNYLNRNAATTYGLCTILLLSAGLFVLTCTAGGVFSFYVAVYSILEISFIFIPYWWLNGRWRMVALIPVWILSVLFLCNILYFRFWNSLMPFSLLSQAKNTNGVLIDSAIGVLRAQDIIFAAAPLAATAIWFWKAGAEAIARQRFSLSKKVSATAISCIAYSLLLFIIYPMRIESRKESKTGYNIIKLADQGYKMAIHPDKYNMTLHNSLIYDGLTVHIMQELIEMFSVIEQLNLTTAEKSQLQTYINNNDISSSSGKSTDKNLIFIIVESLDPEVIDLSVNGRQIAPVMNALCREDGSISCLHVKSQAANGHSSDGQMIYNLGLLPTQKGIAAADYVPQLTNLPSLPRLMPEQYIREAIFADDGIGWNKPQAYKSYGYDNQFSCKDFAGHYAESTSRDGAMLAFALDRAKEIQQPFFLQLMTIQMHSPYNDSGMQKAADYTGSGISEYMQHYLNCTADFDKHLGRFIEGLKKCGLWDNSVLVIASDHSRPETGYTDCIVFIAANCGYTEHIEEYVGQIDVFPTVLDIMGIRSQWRGVGRSMLGARRGESDARQASVSDSILRSDFFK